MKLLQGHRAHTQRRDSNPGTLAPATMLSIPLLLRGAEERHWLSEWLEVGSCEVNQWQVAERHFKNIDA